jgi:ABC-type lipopolysaccharide export system ATPase subunit
VELLSVMGLSKSYEGRRVVDDVSFAVNEAEIVGLLGKNGASKTTTFRMTIGMIPPDAGRVVFEGEDVSRLPMYQPARRGMGYLAQEPGIFQRLSVEDNLLAILETMHLSKSERKAIAAEQYDYSYRDEELQTLAADWGHLAEQADRIFVFFNNCRHGQAAKNARRFMEIACVGPANLAPPS